MGRGRDHYTYHPDMNVPLTRSLSSVLEDGDKETIWDYDDDGDATPNESPTNLVHRIVERGYTRNSSHSTAAYEYVTKFTYNGKGQIESIDGPLSGTDDTTSFTYNATTGNLLTLTRASSGTTTFTTTFSDYDNAGQVGTVMDPNDQSDDFTYDERGRITQIEHNADNSTTSFTYTEGQLEYKTDEDSVRTDFEYDGTSGKLSRQEDHTTGNYILFGYDNQGNVTKKTYYTDSGTTTFQKRYSYQGTEIPGKLFREINHDDTFTQYGYDAEGNIDSVTDPNTNQTTYEYDHLNRLKKVTQPGSVATEYEYDVHGNLTSVTDAEAHETAYIYDDMGRVVEITSPDTGTVKYYYDEAGNLKGKRDAESIDVAYEYDLLNRPTGIDFPASPDISYSYDSGSYGRGRLSGMTDASGSMAFTYDTRGRLIQKASTISSENYSLSRSFTPGGRVQRFTLPSGRRVDFERANCACEVSKITTTESGVTTVLQDNLSYRPFGGATSLSTGNSGSVSNLHDLSGRLEVINSGTSKQRTYDYDNNGNLTSITASNTPWFARTYEYDALNRLTHAVGPYGVIDYTYDDVGNRLTGVESGVTESYSYYENTNKIYQTTVSGSNPVTFTYDDNGNIITMGNLSFTYNQDNRLVAVVESGTTLAEYTYNAFGQRTMKVESGVTTVFHYDFDGNILGESDSDGTFTKEYLYRGSGRIAMVDVDSGTTYFYLNDRLGSPEMMTDYKNRIVWQAIYKPFGEADVHPNSTVTNHFRFPGQYYDQETGFHYNYHRYYDPRTGRYLTPDPIGQAAGINLYTYVGNNPIGLIDPTGLAEGDWWDLRTYIEITTSTTLLGRGTNTPRGGNEQKTISPLTVYGGSIDIYIGVIPTPRDTVYEHGVGLGKHTGVGHFYARPDLGGNFQVQGLVFHVGIGLGSPIFLSETLPDPDRPFSRFMDRELYFTKPCEK